MSMANDQITSNWNLPAGVRERDINGRDEAALSFDALSFDRQVKIFESFATDNPELLTEVAMAWDAGQSHDKVASMVVGAWLAHRTKEMEKLERMGVQS